MVSNTRLYGAAIALVSGGYSVWSASMGMSTTGRWLMLLLGVVVLVHGVVLLTPYAHRLGDASGPLMVGYSLLMLANQLSGAAMGTDASMGMSMGASPTAGMGWDAGMVALALLMLVSGLVMTRDGGEDGGGDGGGASGEGM